MMSSSKFLALLSAVIALSSYASAFFWGSSSQTSPAQPQYYYHKRLLQGPSVYTVADVEPHQQYPVPTVPVQVPLQAQFTPTGIRNVQLVPCLCPVSQDYEYDKVPPAQDNYYVGPSYQAAPATVAQSNMPQGQKK